MIRLLEKMDKSTQVYLMGYSQGLMERVCIPSMNDMTKSEKNKTCAKATKLYTSLFTRKVVKISLKNIGC